MSLIELDNPYTDKNTVHSYLHIYEQLFGNKKNADVNILEIGVHEGGSIKLWGDYFVNGTVYGLDINNGSCIKLHDITKQANIKLFMNTNAYNKDFVNNNLSNIRFDFVIDDGPHTLDSMLFFIEYYIPLLKDDGILIIEDVQDYTWIEHLKNKVPEHLRQHIKIEDMRHVKNRYDDIMFIINKSKINTNK
jgi:hypothetical protein